MKRLPLILLILGAAVFCLGLAHLFRLRFQSGDIYPEYSSLRTDPLGTKALFESLDRLAGARRHYRPLARLDHGRGSALFYLGAASEDLEFPEEDIRGLEAFVATGGRLVLALLPEFRRGSTNRVQAWVARRQGTNAPARKSPALDPRKRRGTPQDAPSVSNDILLQDHWRFGFEYAPLPRNHQGVYQPAPAHRKIDRSLPEQIDCHTALFFTKLDPQWRIIYARSEDRPVVIERALGSGSIVVCADSYYFSNEAMRRRRHPELLSWFAGPSERAVFDEKHLGVTEGAGIATLARKYRLHGVFAGMLLLAGLFIWTSALPFMPPHGQQAPEEAAELVTGRESAAGFKNLLRRNIGRKDLLGVCLAEWKKSCAHRQSLSRLERVQAIIDAENARAPRERRPIRTYREISQALARKTQR